MMNNENFEASFDEQLVVIQQDLEVDDFDFDALPAGFSETPDYLPFCFGYPKPDTPAENPAELLRNLVWDSQSRKRSAAIINQFIDPDLLKASLLRNLSSAGEEAAARILAILVCAEESAVNIFYHEVHRIEAEQVKANKLALMEIESEERIHDWLIQKARAHYPETEDMMNIRRRTRRLFMRVASRDLATHFARISGLDSGVCICLTALLGSEKVTRVEGFANLLRHIRRDEATHVKKARAHSADLGFDSNHFHEAYQLVREGMVDMLTPIGPSFETMGVDPDRLFQRLLRFSSGKSFMG